MVEENRNHQALELLLELLLDELDDEDDEELELGGASATAIQDGLPNSVMCRLLPEMSCKVGPAPSLHGHRPIVLASGERL